MITGRGVDEERRDEQGVERELEREEEDIDKGRMGDFLPSFLDFFSSSLSFLLFFYFLKK